VGFFKAAVGASPHNDTIINFLIDFVKIFLIIPSMKREILDKVRWAGGLVATGSVEETDIKDLERWIAYFQHERLIHLIVTVFVGIADMISILIIFTAAAYPAVALTVLLTVLFAFYIAHYYALENNTQKLYKLFDDMLKIWRNK
jgi:hypothetical protein